MLTQRCQGAYAVTADGRRCLPTHPLAQRFCALGALEAVSGGLGGEVYAVATLLAPCVPGGLPAINDGPDGHRKVLALFDKALAEA